MSLKAEDFQELEGFSIEINEYETAKGYSSGHSYTISDFPKVGIIKQRYSYRRQNDLFERNLAFQFKCMYLAKETFHEVDASYSDSIPNPPLYRHITRIITYKLKYKEKDKKE